jgi:hypothetical protein
MKQRICETREVVTERRKKEGIRRKTENGKVEEGIGELKGKKENRKKIKNTKGVKMHRKW